MGRDTLIGTKYYLCLTDMPGHMRANAKLTLKQCRSSACQYGHAWPWVLRYVQSCFFGD